MNPQLLHLLINAPDHIDMDTELTPDLFLQSITHDLHMEKDQDGHIVLKMIPQNNTNTNISIPSPAIPSSSSSNPVDQVFHVETPATTKSTTKRKLTGHRILTSDEITFNKRKNKEDKENQQKEKERRRKEREEKRAAVGAKGKGIPRKGIAVPLPVIATAVDACMVCHREQVVAPSTAAFDEWVKCGKCGKWVHQQCVPLILHPLMTQAIEEVDDFTCHICTFNTCEQ